MGKANDGGNKGAVLLSEGFSRCDSPWAAPPAGFISFCVFLCFSSFSPPYYFFLMSLVWYSIKSTLIRICYVVRIDKSLKDYCRRWPIGCNNPDLWLCLRTLSRCKAEHPKSCKFQSNFLAITEARNQKCDLGSWSQTHSLYGLNF